MWYKRAEAQKRFTLFYVATQLAGAFGGLLATAVSDLVRLIHPPFIYSREWDLSRFMRHIV